MREKLTKTEKILILCTAAFVLTLCGICYKEIAAGRVGRWNVETGYQAAREELLPPEAGRININTAPVELLMELPGIGEKLARNIVEYRTANGPFRVKSQILQVSGIGAATYRAIEDQITVEEDAA